MAHSLNLLVISSFKSRFPPRPQSNMNHLLSPSISAICHTKSHNTQATDCSSLLLLARPKRARKSRDSVSNFSKWLFVFQAKRRRSRTPVTRTPEAHTIAQSELTSGPTSPTHRNHRTIHNCTLNRM